MAWSTPDISKVTDTLHDFLTQAVTASTGPPLNIPHFNVNVNPASPETARKDDPCQLTLYLLHVGRDPYWRNAPTGGPRPQTNDATALSLNLYYLLTAWADTDYAAEQQAMTIALQAFHSRPILRLPATTDEFTITVEADTIEEMSRLWQAFTVPMRLSSVVKVGVIFVTPASVPQALKPPPVTANLAVGPTPGPADPPILFAAMNLAFAPYPPPQDPGLQAVSAGELVAVGGAAVVLRGAGLDRPEAADVFLSTPDGLHEWRVTTGASWRMGAPDAGDLTLTLPAAYADPASAAPTPPAATPAPGAYRLAVGSGAARSNAVPLVIAARIDLTNGGPPAAGAVYTLDGAGFSPAAGATTVSLGAAALTPTAASPPAPGRFRVAPDGLSIQFALPNPLPPAGVYAVAVTVNGVPCLPGPVVTI